MDLVHELTRRIRSVSQQQPLDPYDEVIGTLAAMNHSKQFGSATVRVYAAALRGVPIDELRDVVWEIVKTRVFPPTVAEVLAAVAERRLNLPEPFAAWEQVAYAASHGAMSDLPETVRRAANAVGGSWDIRNSENPVALRSQFLRAYEEFKKEAQRQTVLALNSDARKEITSGS